MFISLVVIFSLHKIYYLFICNSVFDEEFYLRIIICFIFKILFLCGVEVDVFVVRVDVTALRVALFDKGEDVRFGGV